LSISSTTFWYSSIGSIAASIFCGIGRIRGFDNKDLPFLLYKKSSNNLLKKLTTELKGGIIIVSEG
jgi:hypothetical protein